MGCVYVAKNVINSKLYIGKTKKTLESRRTVHEKEANDIERMNQRWCSALRNALRKHGFDSFDWIPLFWSDDNDELCRIEKLFIKALRTKAPHGYNLTDGGDGFTGRHTDETKEKIRQASIRTWTPERRKRTIQTLKDMGHKPPAPKVGHKQPEETKKKISETLKGHKHSEETKKKISKALKEGHRSGRIKPPKLSEEGREKLRAATTAAVKGITYEERLGKEAADKLKAKRSKQWKGRTWTSEQRKVLSQRGLEREERKRKEKENKSHKQQNPDP